MVRGVPVGVLRPGERHDAEFRVRQHIAETPEKRAVESQGSKVVDEVPAVRENHQLHPDAGFFRKVVGERFVTPDLLEDVVLGSQSDQERLLRRGVPRSRRFRLDASDREECEER
jgi:hypothetical protein